MNSGETLRSLISSLHRNRAPSWFSPTAVEHVDSQYRKLLDALAQGGSPAVYGANTQVGHRDDISLTSSDLGRFQEYLLWHHSLGGPDCHDQWEARCISAAKACQTAGGHLILSGLLFNAVVEAGFAADFHPHVPDASNCSYSAGDVIPGAHWARSLLRYAGIETLGPGEGLALINGSFVHVGLAVSVVPSLDRLLALNLRAIGVQSAIQGLDPQTLDREINGDSFAAYRKNIGLSAAPADQPGSNRQLPVSLRAMPQTINSLSDSAACFKARITEHLFQPSGNPLLAPDGRATNQASFLAPSLQYSNVALLESCLFCAWNSLARLQYLLSGSVPGIPADGVSAGTASLGFIQAPKLASAMLQNARRLVSGCSISNAMSGSDGIEDIWTGGAQVACRTREILTLCTEVLAIEVAIAEYLHATAQTDYEPLVAASEDILDRGEVLTEVKSRIAGLLPETDLRDELAFLVTAAEI